jgi:hypothetical protein
MLRRREKTVNNPTDADQVFRQLLKKAATPEDLALSCDAQLLPVLQQCLAIVAPNLQQPLQLLAALGAEKLSYGIYASCVQATFRAFLEAPGFIATVRTELLGDTLSEPAAIAWMLLKLAPEMDKLRQCLDPAVKETVQLLLTSSAPGMDALKARLATVFASVAPPPSSDGSGWADAAGDDDGSAALLPESLAAAKAVMRPPGVRDHDNDHQDFRSIKIIPTPAELNCKEGPYLPPEKGSAFINDREAAMLDRQFRLMREDLVGSVREELIQETAGKWGHLASLCVSLPKAKYAINTT